MADVMMKSFPTLQKLLDRLRAESRSRIGHDIVLTDRLKAMLSVAVALVVLAALIGMHQTVSSFERDYERVQIDKARLEAQIKAGGWQERKQQSQVLKSLLEERLCCFRSCQPPALIWASKRALSICTRS